MLQKSSTFIRQACTIQRRLQFAVFTVFAQIRCFSESNKCIVVKNPRDELKRYEDLYDEVSEIFKERNIKNG